MALLLLFFLPQQPRIGDVPKLTF